MGARVPLVLGTYVAPWPQPRTLATVVIGLFKRAIEFMQQSQAATLLVTTRLAAETRIVPYAPIQARIRYQKHGVDTDRFKPLASKRSKVAKQVLFVANLTKRKGIFTLLDAFVEVRKQLPDASLLVCGGGEEGKGESADGAAAAGV